MSNEPTEFAKEMAAKYPLTPEQVDFVEETFADLMITGGFGPADLERVREHTRQFLETLWGRHGG